MGVGGLAVSSGTKPGKLTRNAEKRSSISQGKRVEPALAKETCEIEETRRRRRAKRGWKRGESRMVKENLWRGGGRIECGWGREQIR